MSGSDASVSADVVQFAPAVQRTNELVYNATRAVFPSHDVAIVQYDYVSAPTAAPRPIFAPLRCNSD